jgi:hypothetical protein
MDNVHEQMYLTYGTDPADAASTPEAVLAEEMKKVKE